VATGNAQLQFILSTADIANIEQQALIKKLMLQNTVVAGCSSQTVNSVPACTGIHVPAAYVDLKPGTGEVGDVIS